MPEKGHKMIEVKDMYYPNKLMREKVVDALNLLDRYCKKEECGNCILYDLCIGDYSMPELNALLEREDPWELR